jgi:5-formaminoimidazole-4-carboxamide-1-beta-D-ribofuranosyl 5'-monophosphate synthetase
MANRLLRVLANDSNKLCRSDVVSWLPSIFPRVGREVLLKELFLAGKTVAATHEEIMPEGLSGPSTRAAGGRP